MNTGNTFNYIINNPQSPTLELDNSKTLTTKMSTDLYTPTKKEVTVSLIDEQSTQDQLDCFKSKLGSTNHLDTQAELLDPSVQEAVAKIQQIDQDFASCWCSVYKAWISVLMVLSCTGLMLGIVYIFSRDLAYVFIVEVIGCIWNVQQLYTEYQAIEDKNMNKANKAMVSFKAFIVVIPILFAFAAIIDNFEPKGILIGFFSIAIAFYFLVVLGASKVKAKLVLREFFKMKLEGTFIEV